jgi:hypothetical protein
MRLTIRTLAHALFLVCGAAVPLVAQEGGRLPGRGGGLPQGTSSFDDPNNWVSLSFGFQSSPIVRDGSTSSSWDFGSGYPLRVTLERHIGSGATVGVAGSYVRMPLEYASSSNAACTRCDAHATVATYGVVAHVGGGLGFYNAFELFIGAIQYGGFERDDDGTKLPPTSPNVDFAFSPSYGLGYGFARDWKGELAFNWMYTVHERKDLPNNAQVLGNHFLIRAGLRVGF